MNTVILAIYPNTRGFGYACVELPERLLDHGVVTIRPIENAPIIKRITKQLDYFKPNVVLLRSSENPYPKAKRISRLVNEVTELAIERDIPVHQYSREQIKFVFERFGVTTNYEIAKKLTTWIEALKDIELKASKAWEGESYNQGVFDALSLAVCYGYLDM